jgi:hypothetical protein
LCAAAVSIAPAGFGKRTAKKDYGHAQPYVEARPLTGGTCRHLAGDRVDGLRGIALANRCGDACRKVFAMLRLLFINDNNRFQARILI